MLPILTFWLIVQFFTLAALPLAWRLFAALPSRGYALAKPLGLLLVTYVLWLAGSLGFLRNSAGGILLSWVVVAAVSLWLGRAGWQRDAAGRRPGLAWLVANKWLIVVTELLFFFALAGWAAVRSYSPEITTSGGEKFMELMFLNGILRSEQFPPLDPWLSGFAISYYYFGYIMLAALTRLSGLASGIAFNVGLATWFALTLAAAFGIAFDMAAALLARVANPSAPPSTDLPTSQSKSSPSAYIGGLLGALFVGLLSNLAGFLEWLHNMGVGPLAFWRWLDIKDLNCLGGAAYTEPIVNCPAASGVLPDRFFWWWRASRVINDRDLLGNAVEVIDEFPFFSFLLGDMHPHVLALPFVLLAIGLALAVVLRAGHLAEGAEGKQGNGGMGRKTGEEAGESFGQRVREAVHEFTALFPMGAAGFGLYALCLGGLAFLNTWDFPIYVFLVMLALGVGMAWQRGGLSWGVAGKAVLAAATLGVTGIVLFLPFYIGFQSQAGGILPNFIFPTRLAQFFVMFGPLLAAAIFFLLALSADGTGRSILRSWLRFVPLTVLAPIGFLLVMLVMGVATPGGQELISRLRDLPVVREQVGDASLLQIAGQVIKLRIGSPWTYLLLAGLLAWVLALLANRLTRRASDHLPAATSNQLLPATRNLLPVIFALLTLLTALLLTFSVEFVYLRDSFGVRMNTVFKFYYQAWVLLALVAAFAVIYLAHFGGRFVRAIGLAVIALLVVAGLFYPVFATYTRAEQFARQPTLDGTAHLDRDYPGDAAAIAWLRANVPSVATVLEAPGGSYSYFGRIAAQTGLPTLLGWEGHELQWRGNTVEQDKRRPDVERIFRNAQGAELERLLETWQIDYVLVGDLERQTFSISPQSEARFARAMDLVYDGENVRIYRRRG